MLKSRPKWLLIREMREHRNKGLAVKKQFKAAVVPPQRIHTHNDLTFMFEVFCGN